MAVVTAMAIRACGHEEFFQKQARLPVDGPELFRVVTVDHVAAGIVSILHRQD
jgi:hypothetical protein